MTDITGVVLAGGESSRMGEDKSLMLFREQQLIEFSLSALTPFCKKVFISSNKTVHKKYKYKTIADKYKQIGPIAGVHSALKNTDTDYVIILPCDSPMVKQEFVKYLITLIDIRMDAIVPQYNKQLEPLFAVYHKRILPIVEEQIDRGDYKLVNLLNRVNTKTIEVKDRTCFVNINTPEDYHNFIHNG